MVADLVIAPRLWERSHHHLPGERPAAIGIATSALTGAIALVTRRSSAVNAGGVTACLA